MNARPPISAVLALGLALVAPARGQAPKAGAAKEADPAFLIRSLLDARSVRSTEPGSDLAAVVAELKKKADLAAPGERPLEDVLQQIREQTKGKALPKGIAVHFDPVGGREAEKTIISPVKPGDALRRGDHLERLAKSLGMVAYVQRDGVVVITSPGRARRNLGFAKAKDGRMYLAPAVRTPEPRPTRNLTDQAKAAWKSLDRPLAVPFGQGTPLADVFRHLSGAVPVLTIRADGAGPGGAGWPLRDAVIVNLDGPLRSSLALALDQLGLTYEVRGDGVVELVALDGPPDQARAPGHDVAGKAVGDGRPAKEPPPGDVPTLLAALRRSGKERIAQAIEQRLQLARQQLGFTGGKGLVIVGRVVVEGPLDPRQVAAQMRIEEDGYFVGAVAQAGKPVGFRAEGYEPIDVIPRGEPGGTEMVGEVHLRRLPEARKARLQGKVVLEGQPDAAGAIVNLHLSPWPINSAAGGYEGDRGPSPPPPPVAPGGQFSAGGLTPSKYHLYVESPGYFSLVKDVELKPGQETDVGELRLELGFEMAVTFATAQGEMPGLKGLKPETRTVVAEKGVLIGKPEAGEYRKVEVSRFFGGRPVLRSPYGPFLLRDLGAIRFQDVSDVDLAKFQERFEIPDPQPGHVYAGHWTYDHRWVLFSIDRLEKVTPARALDLRRGASRPPAG